MFDPLKNLPEKIKKNKKFRKKAVGGMLGYGTGGGAVYTGAKWAKFTSNTTDSENIGV